MCQHDKFEILFYNGYLLVRKCVYCGEVEYCTTQHVADHRELAHLMREIEGPEANGESPSQEPGTVLTDRCWSCGHIFGFPANYCPQCNADQANPRSGAWTCTCERCLREKPL